MDFEISYYFVDRNRDFKFDTLEDAKAFAKELSKELKYFPVIQFEATVID